MEAVATRHRASDPFAHALMPSPGETEDERTKRVLEQEEAARVSREIDESLLETKKLIEKRKTATKVLLLGKLIHPPAYLSSYRSFCSKDKLSPARAQLSKVSARTHIVSCLSYSYDCRHNQPQIFNSPSVLPNSRRKEQRGDQSFSLIS